MRLRRFVAVASLSVAVLAAVSLGGWALWDRGRDVVRRGTLPLPSVGAELLFLDAGKIVRRGPSTVIAVRFEGDAEFQPHHFRADGLSAPQPIEAWAARLGAPVVFNAGQFDEGLEYLGWLKRDGRWLSQKRKGPWKGLLVSGPVGEAFWARVVDLDYADPTIVDDYRNVVQSMMLLDSANKLRVRDTELSACRTVIAEDARGRILVLVTEGATTLGDLARWLARSPLGIVRAMNLDGGVESQLAVSTPELELALYGQYGTTSTVWNTGAAQVRYPIPAVVAVRPRAPSGR